MWKRSSDIFPGEWVGTEYESEAGKELNIGDKAKVIVDSQFRDKYEQRRINQIGTVVEIDTKDDGHINWSLNTVIIGSSVII